VEVDAGGSGGGPVRARTRLNIVLFGVILLATVGAALLAVNMSDAHESKGGDTSGGWFQRAFAVVVDKQSDGATSLVGTDVGPGLVQAVNAADEEEQVRWATIIDAATGMATAFLNIDYKDLETTREAVLERATGAFEKQYEKSFDGLTKLTQRAKSVQTGEVVWAGLSSVDDDSATVFLAANTKVTNINSPTPQAKSYRVQIELELVDDEWLARDLRFIDAAAPEGAVPDGAAPDGDTEAPRQGEGTR
jgi:Mce-associated membrane protein